MINTVLINFKTMTLIFKTMKSSYIVEMFKPIYILVVNKQYTKICFFLGGGGWLVWSSLFFNLFTVSCTLVVLILHAVLGIKFSTHVNALNDVQQQNKTHESE